MRVARRRLGLSMAGSSLSNTRHKNSRTALPLLRLVPRRPSLRRSRTPCRSTSVNCAFRKSCRGYLRLNRCRKRSTPPLTYSSGTCTSKRSDCDAGDSVRRDRTREISVSGRDGDFDCANAGFADGLRKILTGRLSLSPLLSLCLIVRGCPAWLLLPCSGWHFARGAVRFLR
jgi:hypothetical protein